jgi:23S rRNA pseudouridine1911/1915/1917 synthase
MVEALGAGTLLRFELETGRTHQIRMHARHLGYPIYGDDLYGRPPRDPPLRELWTSLGRHALHAAVLGFEHPGGTRLRFESELPEELQRLKASLSATVSP